MANYVVIRTDGGGKTENGRWVPEEISLQRVLELFRDEDPAFPASWVQQRLPELMASKLLASKETPVPVACVCPLNPPRASCDIPWPCGCKDWAKKGGCLAQMEAAK